MISKGLPKNMKFQKMRKWIQIHISKKTFNNTPKLQSWSGLNKLWPVPMTAAVQSKAWTVFACSNIAVMGLNLTWGMDVSLRLFCVCVVLCRYWPCDRLITNPRSPTNCLKIKKLKWSQVFHGSPMLQKEQQEIWIRRC
jgi:hypothetical protein